MICPALSTATAVRFDQPQNTAMLHVVYCLGKECPWWVENPEQEGSGDCAVKVIAERLPR